MKNTIELKVKKNIKVKLGQLVYVGKDGFVYPAKTKYQIIRSIGSIIKKL